APCLSIPCMAPILPVWLVVFNKNVTAKCKPFFTNGEDWERFLSRWVKVTGFYNRSSDLFPIQTFRLCRSQTEEQFDINWMEINISFSSTPGVLNNLLETWIPYKERFVSAWADTKIHFGNVNTSRVEGQHQAAIKNYLKVSTLDIRDVCNRIDLSMQNQWKEYEAKLSSNRIRVSHCLNVPFYRNVIRKISTFALLQVHKQFRISKQPLNEMESRCSFTFTSSMGLPCSHAIKIRMAQNDILSVDDFHPQWRIDDSCPPAAINPQSDIPDIEPLLASVARSYDTLPQHQQAETINQLYFIANQSPDAPSNFQTAITRGRPSGARNREDTSTRRHPSAFERADNQPRAARRCRQCGQTGHDRRTCSIRPEETSCIEYGMPDSF
ncbi:hypothetical protein BVRB_016790, partial [Beta vulgaris subsp. vulgaris]